MEVSGQLHAPTASPLGKRSPGTHWIGDWEGPRTGLETVSNGKIPSPRQESDPDHRPVASRYTDWAMPADNTEKYIK
jgi:hypothetical protein